ncbi:zinc-binding dehydrogenase [Nocardioides convexus]|uniref:zinc-binding dehydrogenase n=1 Tax=Nocardioides convexus TaxID=2712224 RepID=UPI0024186DD1|nr:zinc-binding dehydrogenase [Nocardioides convexus]
MLASAVDDVAPGALVFHRKAYATHSLVDDFRVIDVADGVPLSAYLGVLGGTGLTAWVGLTRVARLQPGESILITAAGGAVGSTAGHLAKALGAARVAGSTGSDDKAERLLAAGAFDEVVNYRTTSLHDRYADAGFDVALEGVGGEQARCGHRRRQGPGRADRLGGRGGAVQRPRQPARRPRQPLRRGAQAGSRSRATWSRTTSTHARATRSSWSR